MKQHKYLFIVLLALSVVVTMISCKSKQEVTTSLTSVHADKKDSIVYTKVLDTTKDEDEVVEAETIYYDTSLKPDSITGLYPILKKETTKTAKKINTTSKEQEKQVQQAEFKLDSISQKEIVQKEGETKTWWDKKLIALGYVASGAILLFAGWFFYKLRFGSK